MPIFLLPILTWLKSKFFNLKAILFTTFGILIALRYWYLKFQLERKEQKIKKYEGYFKTNKVLDDLVNEKKKVQPGQSLKDRFPKK